MHPVCHLQILSVRCIRLVKNKFLVWGGRRTLYKFQNITRGQNKLNKQE